MARLVLAQRRTDVAVAGMARRCILLVAVFTFWRLVVTAVLGTLASDWNGSRLAPTFALLYGYQLYYPATEGPITNHVYGPVAALAYLPATIFRTPTPAILAGGALQVAFRLRRHAGIRLARRRARRGRSPADRSPAAWRPVC